MQAERSVFEASPPRAGDTFQPYMSYVGLEKTIKIIMSRDCNGISIKKSLSIQKPVVLVWFKKQLNLV